MSMLLFIALCICLHGKVVMLEGFEGAYLADCDKGQNSCYWRMVTFDDYYGVYGGLQDRKAISLDMIINDDVQITYYTGDDSEWRCFENMDECKCEPKVEDVQWCKPKDGSRVPYSGPGDDEEDGGGVPVGADVSSDSPPPPAPEPEPKPEPPQDDSNKFYMSVGGNKSK